MSTDRRASEHVHTIQVNGLHLVVIEDTGLVPGDGGWTREWVVATSNRRLSARVVLDNEDPAMSYSFSKVWINDRGWSQIRRYGATAFETAPFHTDNRQRIDIWVHAELMRVLSIALEVIGA